jgi:hypothetical protein
MRHRLAAACVTLLLLLGNAAQAGTALDPALQQQLLDIFDRYNQAIAAGKVEEAMKLRSADSAALMRKDLAGQKQRKEFLAFAKETIPDKLDVQRARLLANGTKASILTIASKTFKAGSKLPGAPPPGTVMRSELTLDFIKEAKGWTYDSQTFGMDPDKIKACPDEKFEPVEAYDQDKDVSLGGPLTRVVFKDDHTLLVLRVLDEENCAFLPSRDKLEKEGFNPDLLEKFAIVEIEAFPHKSDKQKVWVDNLRVVPEE